MANRWLPTIDVAEIAGRDSRTVKKIAADAGINPKHGPKNALLWPCPEIMEALFGELQSGLDYERERLTREQADNTALKNAQLRKELAPVVATEWALNRVGAQIAAILESIPLRVKRRVPKLTATEVEVIKKEVTKAQNMAAKVTIDLDEYEPESGAESGDTGGDPSRPARARKT